MKRLIFILCLIVAYQFFFKTKTKTAPKDGQTTTTTKDGRIVTTTVSNDGRTVTTRTTTPRPKDIALVNEKPKMVNLSPQKKIDLGQDILLAHKKVSFKSMYLTKMYRKNDLVPFDLFLGWREMSNIRFLRNFRINKNELRCLCHLVEKSYNYKNDYSKYITISSSPKILEKIKSLKKHDLIEIEGYMVHVLNKNGKARFTDDSNKAVDCLYIIKINRI